MRRKTRRSRIAEQMDYDVEGTIVSAMAQEALRDALGDELDYVYLEDEGDFRPDYLWANRFAQENSENDSGVKRYAQKMADKIARDNGYQDIGEMFLGVEDILLIPDPETFGQELYLQAVGHAISVENAEDRDFTPGISFDGFELSDLDPSTQEELFDQDPEFREALKRTGRGHWVGESTKGRKRNRMRNESRRRRQRGSQRRTRVERRKTARRQRLGGRFF